MRNIQFSKVVSDRRYRSDLNLWEERIEILGFVPMWKYLIHRGRLVVRYSFFQKKRKTKKYTSCTKPPIIRIGRKEFEEKYHGNKYLVPINYELDLDLP